MDYHDLSESQKYYKRVIAMERFVNSLLMDSYTLMDR